MKKTLLISGVLLALTASVASAATGVGLYWNDCGAGGGVTNRSFACNTNAGFNDLYISVDPPPNVTKTPAHNHIIDMQSASAALPDWWQYKNPLTCRIGAMTSSTDFTPGTSLGAGCADVWLAAATPDVAAYGTNFGGDASRVRIVGNVSIGTDFATSMNVGTEYYSMRIRFNNTKTVGTGVCAGCQTQICMVLNQVRIGQLVGTPGGDQEVGNPIPGGSNYVTWQGPNFPGVGCPGATPTRNSTWGRLKSLYR